MAYVAVKTRNSIPALIASADAARVRAVTAGNAKMVTYSRSIVPVDTGRLKSSVKSKIVNSSNTTTGTVSYNTEYAIYVEMGTSNMRSQPYLYPAWIEGRNTMILNIASWLRSA